MKVKTRRLRSKNNPYRRRPKNNVEKLPEPKDGASDVEVDSLNYKGDGTTHEENATASLNEVNLATGEPDHDNYEDVEMDESVQAVSASNDTDDPGEAIPAGGDLDVVGASSGKDAVKAASASGGIDPVQAASASGGIDPVQAAPASGGIDPVQAAAANDDEDSGTENDRNEAVVVTDDESEGEKESYQVEVARTMCDIVHTRDMLFTLTRRVDQLLEFCKRFLEKF